MKNGKSTGIDDGVPCEFYKAVWGIVGDDFCALSHEVFSIGPLFELLNQGLKKLIPNNYRRDTIGGLNPITLLDFSYKSIAKDLVVRVRDVAKKVVHQEQTHFLSG